MNAPVAFAVGPVDDPDRYQVGEACGLGGESIVYRARRGEREVAVKILRDDHSGRLDQFARQWMSQVELLRTLRHPAVVRPIEAFIGTSLHRIGHEPTGRTLCLVMEWIEGRELEDVLRTSDGVDSGDPLEILESLRPVAEALDLMHGGELTGAEPVIHGDIKPSNLLLKPSGEAVLVDFGLAGALVRRPTGGTPNYRAPESYRSGNSTSTDGYSFAAVVAAVLQRLPLRPVADGGTPLPASVRAALSPDPSSRPEHLAVWLDEVVTEVRQAAESAPSAMQTTGRSPGGATRRPQWLVAAAAVVLLGGLLVVRGSERPDNGDRAVELTNLRAEGTLCDTAEWRDAPAREFPARWIDPDGDCLHIWSERSSCDADAWREAAERSFPVRWADEDGDCVHTLFELNGLGRDPFVADPGDRPSIAVDLAEQGDAIVWQLVRGTRRHDPVERAECDPAPWKVSATLWSQRDNPRGVQWDDPDDDCLTTTYELRIGTDPTKPDTDGDGYLDSLDPDHTNGLIPSQHRQMGLVLRREQLASAHDLTAADTRARFEALKARLRDD